MIELDYSLFIEVTEDPEVFGFYSPDFLKNINRTFVIRYYFYVADHNYSV
jgi:hypothetical protein